MPSPVQMPGIPAAGAPAPPRAAAQAEVAVAATRSTGFRDALGSVTQRREANRIASAKSEASRATAPTRAKAVVPKKAASARSRGSARSHQREESAAVAPNGEHGRTRGATAKRVQPEQAKPAEDAAPASDEVKKTRDGAPATDGSAPGGAEAAATALAASAASGQLPVAAAEAAAAADLESAAPASPLRGVSVSAAAPAVEGETAEASTAAGDDEIAPDAGTDAAAVLKGFESLEGLNDEGNEAAPPEGAASDSADHPAQAAQPVAGRFNAGQGGTGAGADGGSSNAADDSDEPHGFQGMALASETTADASAAGEATATADKAYARAAEPHSAPDATAPFFDGAPRASAAPDVRHAAAAPPQPPEVRFAERNHPKLITAVRGELLPDGGSMQIRLDPPELGDLLVSVELRAGVVTASFQTSNDTATRLLSHSLADLKGMLEQQGVTVDRLQVRQSPRDDSSGDAPQDRGQGSGHAATADDRHSARRDQHRRDLIQKMWDKLAGRDPLDLVA